MEGEGESLIKKIQDVRELLFEASKKLNELAIEVDVYERSRKK